MNEYDFTERHMGTDVSLAVVTEDAPVATTIATYIYDVIKSYEQRFSRFLPDSELMVLNTKKSCVVSDPFITVLTRSLALSRLTVGAFNPLTQVATLGYTETFQNLQKRTAIPVSPRPYDTDVTHLTIDPHTHEVTLAPNQALDFGGILKGYLAAHLADTVMEQFPACTGLIINIGGDLATRGHDQLHQPFTFALYNPVTGAETFVPLTDQSLATSGTYNRTWHTGTGTQHHIVDAATRENPDSPVVAASIMHPDGALTEALAKLFIVRGVAAALQVVPATTHNYTYYCVGRDGSVISNCL